MSKANQAVEPKKITKVYLQVVTNILGMSGVTEISEQKTPEFRMHEGEHGIIVVRGDISCFVPYANVKVAYY